MLRLSPRNITAAVLASFALLLGIQHFIYSLQLLGDDTDRDTYAQLEARIPLLLWLERTDFDMHLRYQREEKGDPRVVVLDVNERTIQQLGQFPFARSTYATLLRRLEGYGTKVTAFDITFPERERNHSLEDLGAVREELIRVAGAGSPAVALVERRMKKIDGDEAFAAALAEVKMPVILGFAFAAEGSAERGAQNINEEQTEFLRGQFIRRNQIPDNAFVNSMSDKIPILPHRALLKSLGPNSGLGFFTALPDPDSVIRRAAAVIGYQGTAVASLAVRAVASYLGVQPELVGGRDGLSIRDREQTGALHVPLLPVGSYLLRYYGGYDALNPNFTYVDFADVLSEDPGVQKATAEKLKDKIVFVGVTVEGLKDIRANPFTKNYPGVEVHATFASNMLTKTYLEKDRRYFYYGYFFLMSLGVLAGLLVFKLHPLWAFPPLLALLGVFQVLAHQLLFTKGVVVPTLIPSFATLGVFFTGVLYRYFTEEKEKRMVRTAFSRYVSGPVVEEILLDPTKLKLGGQKRELTVMFSDLAGFTKFSEQMDAAQLTTLLNEYFTRMTRIILQNQGTLDKYMGDAIMCFWGAPLDIPNHAAHACRTALAMREELGRINEEWKAKHNMSIGMRIGINTGEMNVGNMGSEQVFSYTVMGDNVNLGSRLEGVNNVYGTAVIVSRATAAAAGPGFNFRTLDFVQVKGKEEAVEILELLPAEEAKQEWVHAFTQALTAYRAAHWEEAEENFRACLALRPEDKPSEVFLARIEELRSQATRPAASWDGVWKLTSK